MYPLRKPIRLVEDAPTVDKICSGTLILWIFLGTSRLQTHLQPTEFPVVYREDRCFPWNVKPQCKGDN